MNKEELLKQKQAIDAALAAIAKQEDEAQELHINQERKRRFLYVPLKNATVDEALYFANPDDKIEVEGYCTAGEILDGPAFDEGEELVLIRTEKNRLIWVSKRDDGEYEDSEESYHMTEDEADGYITIIE